MIDFDIKKVCGKLNIWWLGEDEDWERYYEEIKDELEDMIYALLLKKFPRPNCDRCGQDINVHGSCSCRKGKNNEDRN